MERFVFLRIASEGSNIGGDFRDKRISHLLNIGNLRIPSAILYTREAREYAIVGREDFFLQIFPESTIGGEGLCLDIFASYGEK